MQKLNRIFCQLENTSPSYTGLHVFFYLKARGFIFNE